MILVSILVMRIAEFDAMQINGNMIRLATVVLGTLIMVACRSVGRSPLVLDSDLWVVVDSSMEVAPTGGATASPLSIEFLNDGQLNGLTSCNSFTGSYMTSRRDSVNQLGITIEGITLSLCPDSERERRFIEQLNRTRSYLVRNGELQLMDESGTVMLTFVPASMTQKNKNKSTL